MAISDAAETLDHCDDGEGTPWSLSNMSDSRM